MTSSRVLMIAYAFPPIGGSGVYRTAKFVKYLPQFGWQPIVVCGDRGEAFGLGYDESLLAEVPVEARVLRTRFVSPYALRLRFQHLFHMRPVGDSDVRTASSKGQEAAGALGGEEPGRATLRLLGRVLHPLERPPIDIALYWALSIVRPCLRAIEEAKVDVIYTSSDPYSDHIAGWILKRLTGKPWVADFRDPWTQAWNYSRGGWRRRFDLFAEQCVLHYADRIIGVTSSQTRGLLGLVSGRNPADFMTIENGFDEADFPPEVTAWDNQPQNQNPRVILSYVGIAYEGTALPFLETLARLGPAGEKLKVRFVGGLAPQELRWLQDHPLDGRVEVIGRLPHAEAIGHMRASDALLMIFGEGLHWTKHYSGKLFEYMAAGRPIVLVGPEGDASRLLAASGTGVRLPLEQQEVAVAMLCALAADPAGFRARYYHPDPQVIARYERRALAGRLAGLLDQVVAERSETT